MLSCDNPPPVTVVLDPGDDLVHTRAALAALEVLRTRAGAVPCNECDAAVALSPLL
jgi:hypothetical protein